MRIQYCKPSAAFLFALLALLSCSRPASPPSAADLELAKTVGFPSPVIAAAKSAGPRLRQLQGIRDDGDRFPANGITIDVTSKEARAKLESLRSKIQPLGYEAYLAETHFGHEPDKLAVVPAGEKFDFLKLRSTNGWNYDLSPEQIRSRLQDWDRRYGLKLVGADFDWVQADFVRQPTDMVAFAKEVYTFCPDVVDQGTETVERLAAEMQKTNSLYLWWD